MDQTVLLRAKDLAAKHLGRRMRSERELRVYLERKGFGAGVVDRVVRDFRRVGLVNDRALVEEWTERRLANHPCGRPLIERGLLARGLPEETVAEVLDGIGAFRSEANLARRAAEAYLVRLRRLEPEAQRKRLYRFLLGRGFSQETATGFVDEIES